MGTALQVSPAGSVSGTALAAHFIEKDCFPLVQHFTPANEREVCLSGYFQRLVGTIRGMARLDQPSFFQLTLAGARNALEVLVDVVLLAHGKPEDAGERIFAWEASARLKASEAASRHLKRDGGSQSLLNCFAWFGESEKAAILANRLRYWPEGHPDRWTGRNLLEDCKNADRLEPFQLKRFYETQCRQMNWSIHGSGFAGVRGVSVQDIDLIFSFSHIKVTEFSLRATQLVLRSLGLLEADVATKLLSAGIEATELSRPSA